MFNRGGGVTLPDFGERGRSPAEGTGSLTGTNHKRAGTHDGSDPKRQDPPALWAGL